MHFDCSLEILSLCRKRTCGFLSHRLFQECGLGKFLARVVKTNRVTIFGLNEDMTDRRLAL